MRARSLAMSSSLPVPGVRGACPLCAFACALTALGQIPFVALARVGTVLFAHVVHVAFLLCPEGDKASQNLCAYLDIFFANSRPPGFLLFKPQIRLRVSWTQKTCV